MTGDSWRENLLSYVFYGVGRGLKQEGNAMTNLTQVNNGQTCRITWLLGRYSDIFRKLELHENDMLQMIQNQGRTLLFKHCGKKLAMSADMAVSIKVCDVI